MRLFFKVILATWIVFNILAASAGYNQCSSPFSISDDVIRDRLDVITKGTSGLGHKFGCWLAGSPEITSDEGDSEE